MSTHALLETGYEYPIQSPPPGAILPQDRNTSNSSWSLPVVMPRRRVVALWAKRALDVMVACAALTVLAPLMIVIAIAVLIDSPGSVLYRTYRVGKQGRPFPFYKFRTMVSNADLMLEEVWSLNERKDVLFKVSRDPRVTRVGRFLRRYSLDELPQFWNILRGEMSLVGPRPPLMSEYEKFQPEHRRRMEVSPGLTGLWQVMARRDPSFETYVRLDCHYVEHWNLWLDLKILLKTIPAVLGGNGE
jgi:exopolysaccharide biosynthesis polyprenyl glycosylphosphotransferase